MPVETDNAPHAIQKQPQQDKYSIVDTRACSHRLSWRTKASVCALSSALALLVAVAAIASVRASVPSLQLVRVALDASSDVSSLTALIDAELLDPTSAWHSARLQGGTCSVDTDCGAGVRCTVLVAQVSEAFYPEEDRAHFVVTTTQASSQNIRHAFSSGAYDIVATCNLDLGVDVFKTGLVVKQSVRWLFDDVASSAAAASAGRDGLRPLLQIRREAWDLRPNSRREANVTLSGNYIAELTLPLGPLARALEALSIGVKADIGYVEAERGALEGRLLVDSDLGVAPNATADCAIISLPFHVQARADLPALAEYAPKAATSVLPSTLHGNLQLFLMDHSLVFKALPKTQAAATLLGQAHVVGWRREGKERSRQAPLSGSNGRSLSVATPPSTQTRRLLSFFGLGEIVGIELQGLETHHRVYLDDDDFMGLDFKLVEGPPFVAAIGVRLDSRALDDLLGNRSAFFGNATLTAHGVHETASLDISLSQYQGRDLQLSENITVELDLQAGSLDATFNLKAREDLDMAVVAGVDANDSLAFVRIDCGDAGNVSLSADFKGLEFEAALHVEDVSFDFRGIKDQVDLEARFADQLHSSMTYRRSETGADIEEFSFAFALEQLTESIGSVPGLELVETLAQAAGTVNFTLNHGRRRTVPKGGTRELTAHISMLPTCSSGAPGKTKAECQDCCERMMIGQLVSGLDLEIGQSIATEGFDVIITDIAGSEGDMDLIVAWDMSNEHKPRASATLRVVDDVSRLNFTLGASASETLLSGATLWRDIMGGKVVNASLFDGSGEFLGKGGIEWKEDSEWRSMKAVMYDSNSTLMASGSGDWKGWAASGVRDHALSWTAHDAEDNQITRGSAWLEETGMGVIVMDREQILNTHVFFDRKPEGDIKMFAKANLDAAAELASVSVEWGAAATWGGDLTATVAVNTSEELLFTVLAQLIEDGDVRTANATALQKLDPVAGLLLATSAGDEASPAFLNATILEGSALTMLASAYGEITNMDHVFDTSDRVIQLAHPIAATGTVDLRDKGRVGSLAWNVAREASGSGDVLTSTAVLATSLDDEDKMKLDVAFDTSTSDRMDVSARLESGGSSLLEAIGSWPYDGDYMEGNLAVDVENHTQVIHTRASRGFLVQQLKPSGYDAFWLSVATVIDGEMMLNLTDLYLERGPDVAWSGIGWSFMISELDGREIIERYSHAFDIDFVPGTPPPIADDLVATSLDVAIEIANLSTFSVSVVAASLANASGVTPDDIVIEEVLYSVKTEYSFDAAVTPTHVTEVVAVANSVLQTQIALAPADTRRLSAAAMGYIGARQAYDVVISTPDVGEASSVLASAADEALLASSLWTVVPDAPAPAIDEAPMAQVTMKTMLLAKTSAGVVEPPSPETVTEQLSEALGQQVAVNVKAETVTTVEEDGGTDPAEQGTEGGEEEGNEEGKEEVPLSGAWQAASSFGAPLLLALLASIAA